MRIRHSGKEGVKIQLQMTPMIDIVFQLLIFFIMTFKIVAQEGDFNIRMPMAAPRPGLPDPDEKLPLVIKLTADADGVLTGIRLQDRNFDNFQMLNEYVISYVGDASGPSAESAEVELDCDYELRYEYVIAAISAVSGYRDDASGQIVKLIEKIKFSPVEKPGTPEDQS